MRIIDGGECLLAVGLDWEASHLGVFTRTEVRRLAAARRATHYVEHRTAAGASGPEHACGFGRMPILPRGEKRPIVSLASAVASARSDSFMFVASLEYGEAVFIGVLSGQPTAGNDFIGSEAEIVEAAARFRDTNSVAQVFYSEHLGRPDFLSNRRFESRPMALDTSPPHTVLQRVARVTPFARVALVCLVMGASVVQLIAWQKAEDEAAMKARVPVISPELAYEASRDDAMRAYSPVPVTAAFPALSTLLMDLGTRSGGWHAQKTRCSWIKDSEPVRFDCATLWTEHGGNFRSFVAPERSSVEYDDTLASVITHQQLEFPSAQMLIPALIEELPSLSTFKIDTGSLLQDLRQLNFKVATSAPVLVGATSEPTGKGRLLRQSWSLEGPVDTAAAFVTALPSNLTLEEAELTIPEHGQDNTPRDVLPTLKLTGGIYVLQ